MIAISDFIQPRLSRKRLLTERDPPEALVPQAGGPIYNNALILVESLTPPPAAPINVRDGTHRSNCTNFRWEFH